MTPLISSALSVVQSGIGSAWECVGNLSNTAKLTLLFGAAACSWALCYARLNSGQKHPANSRPKEDGSPDRFFERFVESLENTTPGTTIIKTAQGATEHCFRCTLREGPENKHFFIKLFRSENKASHEAVGNLIAENLGVRVPKCVKLRTKVDRRIEQLILEQIPPHTLRGLKTNSLQNRSILMMQSVVGLDFKELFLTERYLEIEDWTEIHRELGEAAVLDLFMGNCDRFFALMGSRITPTVNYGNVMLGHLPGSVGSSKPIFIDNAPYPNILTLTAFSLEDKVRELEQAKLPSSRKVAKIALLRERFKEKQYTPELVYNLNGLFTKVLNGEQREVFISTIRAGLIHMARRNLPESERLDPKFYKRIEENLAIGVEEGLRKILASRGDLLPPGAEKSNLARGFLLLIQKNRESILAHIQRDPGEDRELKS